jgi:hypothetical protein
MSDDPLAAYPKAVVLKDGAHLALRPLRAGEHDVLATLLGRVPRAERLSPEAAPVILACDDERVVAAVGLVCTVPEVARLGVTIDPEYRGRRLGTWLLLDGVHLAAGLGVERLEASVRAGDTAYRSALERLDFVADAARGSAASLVLVKRLHRAWTDF